MTAPAPSTRAAGFEPDLDAAAKPIGARTRAIVVKGESAIDPHRAVRP